MIVYLTSYMKDDLYSEEEKTLLRNNKIKQAHSCCSSFFLHLMKKASIP